MNAQLKIATPAMREFNVSNALLDDPAALQAAWDRDGYWFFRDVLDKDAIARMRSIITTYLGELGVIDPADPKARYTGADLTNFPHRLDAIVASKPYRTLTENAKINAFFQRLFGAAPFWVPFTEYRATPPVQDLNRPRFDFIHEDGVYNDGLPFLICWIPLAEIDDDVGGLALAEGLHKGPVLHEKDGTQILPIKESAIPATAWRRTTYQAGDVLLMSLRTPHSGLANLSDRFRLSMDTRIMPSTGKIPIVGQLAAISQDQLTVRDRNGEHTLALDGNSYCRDLWGNKLPRNEVTEFYQAGHDVIIATDNGRVVMMRPQH
jgi:hypothetical protein